MNVSSIEELIGMIGREVYVHAESGSGEVEGILVSKYCIKPLELATGEVTDEIHVIPSGGTVEDTVPLRRCFMSKIEARVNRVLGRIGT